MRIYAAVLLLVTLSSCLELSNSVTRVSQCDTGCETREECERRLGKGHIACRPTSWECVPCGSDAGVR